MPQVVNGVTIQTPQCTAAINANPNPALNVIPPEYIAPIGVKVLQFMPPAGSYFLDGSVVRNYFSQRSVVQNETRYTLRLEHRRGVVTRLVIGLARPNRDAAQLLLGRLALLKDDATRHAYVHNVPWRRAIHQLAINNQN